MVKMKDSGIEWIGEIPASWEVIKGKYLFTQRSSKGNKLSLTLLSPTQKYGVIPQSMYEELTGMKPVKIDQQKDLNLFKTIHKGDFCISLRSFEGGFEYSNYEGVVSPAYQVFYLIDNNSIDTYYKYLFKDKTFIDKMNSYTMSLRDGKNISFNDFGNTYITVPPKSEQQQIADYLDHKTVEIDGLIDKINTEIDTLKQYQSSVITRAVTKGLDPNVPMKDSGIEWIGEIPASWKVARGKNILKLLSRKVEPDYEIITAFRDGQVTLRKNRRTEGFTISTKEIGYQGVKANDLVVHAMDGFAGAIGISDADGKASPVLNVLDSNQNKRYVMYYLRVCALLGVFQALAKGIRIRTADTRWDTLKNLNYLLPSKAEQQKIVDYLDQKVSQIQKVIKSKQQQINQLIEYKNSLIFEYVTGKK